MKALSIKQPWAWLIVNGIKDIENRSWQTNVRGKILIHASKTFDHKGYRFIQKNFNIEHLPKSYQYDLGGFIGQIEIIDCVSSHESKWFFGPFGFVLNNSVSFSFYPFRGQMGFFEVSQTTLNSLASSKLL